MTAGQLNQRIELQKRVEVENARGEKTYSFATFATVSAQVNPKRGREFIAASQNQGLGPAVFKIRFREGIDFTQRLIWGKVAYELVGPPVDEDAHREWLYLYCTKGSGDARRAL